MEQKISDELKLYLVDKLIATYYESSCAGSSADYAKAIIDCVDTILTEGQA